MTENSSNFITFNIVSTGVMVEGFEAAVVTENLKQKLRLPPAHAQAFFEKPRILKKGMMKADAEKFSEKLASLGVETTLEKVEPKLNKPAVGLTLEPLDDEEAPPAAPADSAEPASPVETGADALMRCPRCDHEQTVSEQCENCGVWFHKLNPAQDSSDSEADEVDGASTAGPVAGAAAGLAANAAVDVDEDLVEEEDNLNAKAIAAAAGAAVVGALVWKIIAVSFGYEVGLVAWAIGGAVGFVAASMGSRGMQAGIVCGVLAFGAIALGKYWAAQAVIDEVQQGISEVLGDDTDVGDWYQEFVEDAQVLRGVSDSDASIRQYMVDRGYTEAVNADAVTSEELSEFREVFEPDLRNFDPEQSDSEAWKEIAFGELSDLSAMDVMLDGLGALDILFLLLGVGTAFRLGSRMD